MKARLKSRSGRLGLIAGLHSRQQALQGGPVRRGRQDPTASSPILFDVVFSEPVTGFTNTDVSLVGTSNPTTVNVTGGGASYTVAVSGMTITGTVVATISANVAQDVDGNGNEASTTNDNTVTFVII